MQTTRVNSELSGLGGQASFARERGSSEVRVGLGSGRFRLGNWVGRGFLPLLKLSGEIVFPSGEIVFPSGPFPQRASTEKPHFPKMGLFRGETIGFEGNLAGLREK